MLSLFLGYVILQIFQNKKIEKTNSITIPIEKINTIILDSTYVFRKYDKKFDTINKLKIKDTIIDKKAIIKSQQFP